MTMIGSAEVKSGLYVFTHSSDSIGEINSTMNGIVNTYLGLWHCILSQFLHKNSMYYTNCFLILINQI